MSKNQGKMTNHISYRMRLTMQDGRQMTGTMLAFDKHMNVVLADTEEFRRIKKKPVKAAGPSTSTEEEQKRTVGLAIIRGVHIVSLSVEGPPPADPSTRLGATPSVPGALALPGSARSIGRGLPMQGGMGGPPSGLPTIGGLQGPPPNVRIGQGAPEGFPGGFPPGFGPPAGSPGFPGHAPFGRGVSFPPPGFNPQR